MTAKTDELKPCPFCGGTDLKLFGESAPEWWVTCQTCRSSSPTSSSKGQAVGAWNRRVTQPAASAEPTIDWTAVAKTISAYADDYEMIGESDCAYTPTDDERHMLTDAIHGLLAESEFLALLRGAPGAAQPSVPAVTDEDLMRVFWKHFRNFARSASAVTHTKWKDGIDIDVMSAPMLAYSRELVSMLAPTPPAGELPSLPDGWTWVAPGLAKPPPGFMAHAQSADEQAQQEPSDA